VFRTRIAPLLSPDDLRALRLVSRDLQLVVDELLSVKGAFGLRCGYALTMADVRYAHVTSLLSIDASCALAACASGELADLQWALATFGTPARLSFNIARVARIECMELLIRDHGVEPIHAFRSSCAGGQLPVAQWLTSTFAGLTAKDADNAALRGACSNGHLAVAQWLVSTFHLTATDARALDNAALVGACTNGHLAVAQWLISTGCPISSRQGVVEVTKAG
jgi:hypothetical protein